MNNIAVFVSGNGSNAENIFRHFASSALARVSLIVSDNPQAYALERARLLGVPSTVIPRADFRTKGQQVTDIINGYGIDYIVLAGFLSLIPPELVESYRGRIINIHPALLPAYGGKGMYGDHVHRAVIANGETVSGITIHHVNEHYDEGSVIAQYTVPVLPGDTPESLAQKIHQLEYLHFPEVIEKELESISASR